MTGLGDDPAAATAYAVVEAAYEAHAAADIETWNTAREPGSEPASDQKTDLLYQTQVAMFATEDTFNVVHCTCHGFGDWPDITDSGDLATGYRFTCNTTRTDDFHRAGGVEMPEAFDWVVAEGEVIAVVSDDGLHGDWMKFNSDFRSWLADTHPDVYSTVSFLSVTDFPAAESIPTAPEYVEAFVDQSDRWPRPSSQ